MDSQIVRGFNDKGLERLLESPVNFGNFVRLLPKFLADRLDLTKLELKNRVFIAPDLSKSETDILYTVPCRMNESETVAIEPVEYVLIYLLSELYIRPDNKIGKKIYDRRGQIWENEDRKWQQMTSDDQISIIVEQTASRTNMNRKEVNTMIVTGADVLCEEGIKLGVEKGKREGKRAGRREGKIEGKREVKVEALSEVKQTLYELLLVDIESKFGAEAANKAIAGKTYDASETLAIIRRLIHATKIEDLGL